MVVFTQLLVLVAITAWCFYQRSKMQTALIALGGALFLMTLVSGFRIFPWLLYAPVALIWYFDEPRRQFLTKPIFNLFKTMMPTMSDTERDALEAGDVWIDGELFQGNPDWQQILDIRPPKLSDEERDFLDNQVTTLCAMIDDWQIIQDKAIPEPVLKYIREQGFFGMIIPKEYGGLEFSALAHSTIVAAIASRSASVAVTVMVPNSLGPAELLLHYGTEEQKQQYLPGLANGTEIPCFALTGPEAGSDAGAMTDTGVVKMGKYQGKEVLGMELSWNKRYITLSPVATVLGLAFQLRDPEHLLGDPDKSEYGITCALIPTSHPGVIIGQRHYPMGQAFMNGPTQGENVFIPLDWIVGGQEYAGKGWRMLVELLSIGRAISLPAMATAIGKLSYRMTGSYSLVREQFNTSISNFEGVQESLARIAGYTYRLEATRQLTAHAVDLGIKPSVVSAIAKYHMTEMSRTVINDAMDVHAGRAVIMGDRNYLSTNYMAIPISITVEGANILTRNLMIFGQGAIRCHPHVYKEMEAIKKTNEYKGLLAFDKAFFYHLGYSTSNLVRTLWLGLSGARLMKAPVQGETAQYYRQLTRMSSALALVADFSMLVLGGELKVRERLSARLGDVLSELYIGTAVLKYYEDQGKPESDLPYVHWSLQTSLTAAQSALADFCNNFPVKWLGKILWPVIFPWGRAYRSPSDQLDQALVQPMVTDNELRNRLTRDAYFGTSVDDITGLMEDAFIKVLAAAPAAKKLRKAIKSGAINEITDYDQLLSNAVDQGVVSKEEAALLAAARSARWNAIQVDDYSPEWFNKKSG
jgi:alkylation response protein AidB-like acyl-CoA dehydrogenase